MLTPVRTPVQLRSSSSNLFFVPKVNASIGAKAFAMGAPTLEYFPSGVKSVENIAKFLYNIAYLPSLPGVSINLMAIGFVY